MLGACTFDCKGATLFDRDGAPVELRAQTSAVLAHLAENIGEIVSKDTLAKAVWRETFVTDDSLVQCISEIRKAIHDRQRVLVQTIVKKGYRLNAAEVSAVDSAPKDTAQILPDFPQIAVLAFDDLSHGVDKGFLSDAITEGIITELGRFQEVGVTARNSSFAYRQNITDIRSIASDLNVHYVLEGSQQKDGDRLRVIAQLIDGGTGNHIWSESYDREMDDIFATQTEIINMITLAVGREISTVLPRSGGLSESSPFHFLLRGKSAKPTSDKTGSDVAEELCHRGILADPSSPYGYIGLAQIANFRHSHQVLKISREDTLELAGKYGEQALRVNRENSLAHTIRAMTYLLAGEREKSLGHYKRAVRINPHIPDVYLFMAMLLWFGNETQEAVDQIEMIMARFPSHPEWYHEVYALALWHNEQNEEALSEIHQFGPVAITVLTMMAVVYISVGRQADAEETMDKFMQAKPEHTLAKERAIETPRYKDPAKVERWLDGLRQAGMPE